MLGIIIIFEVKKCLILGLLFIKIDIKYIYLGSIV